MKAIGLVGLFYILILMETSASFPTDPDSHKVQPETEGRGSRQIIQRNPDGSITASFAGSQAFQVPGVAGFGGGGGGAFDFAETVNIGPQGATFGGGQSFSSDIGGNRMSTSNSNSQNSRFHPNGFSSTGGNSASNSFSNPFFQTSNAHADAFANQFANNYGF